jgi:hypothetical protein
MTVSGIDGLRRFLCGNGAPTEVQGRVGSHIPVLICVNPVVKICHFSKVGSTPSSSQRD